MNNRDHDDYPLDNDNAAETAERSYRRGVHQALYLAKENPQLVSDKAVEIARYMRTDIEKDYPFFLHTILEQLAAPLGQKPIKING